MVEVGGYYYLSAQEIESVFCVKGSADYPYKLTVIERDRPHRGKTASS